MLLHVNLIHILGFVSTGLILLLSRSNQGFTDPGDPDLSSKLNAMQFVAGIHAIILTMSIGPGLCYLTGTTGWLC